jgi:NitT/TauT family transport system substrate-binding protein
MLQRLAIILCLPVLILLVGCGDKTASKGTGDGKSSATAALRLGYFANLTHAQALVGVANGEFQKSLGGTKLETKVFNAGPQVIEAIYAKEIDVAYIGPSPAVNGFIKSNGEEIRVISGASANGVAIVVAKDSKIESLKDLAGKRIATPQYGNTQDVSARHYLKTVLKAKLKDDNGDTDVQPVANADQLNLFKQGQLDASWAPEPWASRLINEAGAKLIGEEKDLWESKRFCTALVIVRAEYLKENPAAVEAFLKAHTSVTKWINANRDDAARQVNAELQKQVGKSLKDEVLKDAFGRVEFSTDPLPDSVNTFAQWSKELGLIKTLPDLKPLFELSIQKKLDGEAPAK